MAKKSLSKRIRKRLRRSPTMAFLSSSLAWFAMHLIFFSCRKEVFGLDTFEKLLREQKGKLMGASWHRGIFFVIYYFRNRDAAVMSSRSGDGNFITAVLRRFGFFTPRGSSGKGKGGGVALKQFIGYINQNHLGGLAVDAPKGPPYVSKPGIIAAASRTGAPLLPLMWYATPNYRIRSWDRTIIPKPFSRLVLVFDREALYIPTDATQADIETCRDRLDQRLLRLTHQTDHWFECRDRYADPRDIPVPEPVPAPHHPE